jgi:hypothetical protein
VAENCFRRFYCFGEKAPFVIRARYVSLKKPELCTHETLKAPAIKQAWDATLRIERTVDRFDDAGFSGASVAQNSHR